MSIKAIDIAYSYLKENSQGIPFKQLWGIVKDELGYSDEVAKARKSQFYTDLSIDGRFIQLENYDWNLKSHCKYDEVKAAQEETEEEEEEEEENDEEYVEDASEESEEF